MRLLLTIMTDFDITGLWICAHAPTPAAVLQESERKCTVQYNDLNMQTAACKRGK